MSPPFRRTVSLGRDRAIKGLPAAVAAAYRKLARRTERPGENFRPHFGRHYARRFAGSFHRYVPLRRRPGSATQTRVCLPPPKPWMYTISGTGVQQVPDRVKGFFARY